MFPRGLAPAWTDLHRELMAACRTILVHDDSLVAELIEETLEGELQLPVFRPHLGRRTTESVLADAAAGDNDLIITGASALEANPELVWSLAQGNHDWIVIDNELTPELIERAYSLGASCVTNRPLNMRRFLSSRLRSVLELRTSRRLLDLMVRFLRNNIPDTRVADIEDGLRERRDWVDERIDVVIVDRDARRAGAVAAALADTGYQIQLKSTASSVVEMTISQQGPHLVLIPIDHDEAAWLAQRLAEESNSPSLVVTTADGLPNHRWLEQADDVVVGAFEGVGAMIARTRRLVTQNRRRALYNGLVETLFAVAQQASPRVLPELVFAEPHQPSTHARTDLVLGLS